MQFGPEMGPEIPVDSENACGLAGNFDSGFFRSADGKNNGKKARNFGKKHNRAALAPRVKLVPIQPCLGFFSFTVILLLPTS